MRTQTVVRAFPLTVVSEVPQSASMRVLIADDHDLVREAIAAFLKSEGVIEVVTVPTLDDAIRATDEGGNFDLVLLDYNMPGMNGLDGLTRMIAANDRRPVALLSGNASRAVAEQAIRAGAAGFVPKTMSSRSMVTAVKFMAAGEIYAPFNFMQQADTAAGNLSQRETDVLRGLCEGKSNKEIARDLDLQEVTIKLHVKTLSRKLSAKNRTHAAMLAREMNLI
jgi:two-component system, NarL family, nitrate/nitrite response regulator NarL